MLWSGPLTLRFGHQEGLHPGLARDCRGTQTVDLGPITRYGCLTRQRLSSPSPAGEDVGRDPKVHSVAEKMA